MSVAATTRLRIPLDTGHLPVGQAQFFQRLVVALRHPHNANVTGGLTANSDALVCRLPPVGRSRAFLLRLGAALSAMAFFLRSHKV